MSRSAVRVLTSLSCMLASTIAMAQVVMKPCDPAATKRQIALVRDLANGSKRAADKLRGDTVICGPRHFARLPEDMRRLFEGSPTMTFWVDLHGRPASWDLASIDASKLPDDIRGALMTTAQQTGRSPIEAGVIKKPASKAYVVGLQSMLRCDAPVVRESTTSELEYYWALIPYDLEAPVLTVETKDAAYLLDFQDGRLLFVELLPPGLAVP